MRPAVGAVGAMARALDVLTHNPGSVVTPGLAQNSGAPSIAPTILAFATGGTANCSGGRGCAKLYLAMQGKAIPIRDITTGMDLTRLQWWGQAMAEYATDRWGGTAQGTKAIEAAQPLIWEQAQAATKAWERMKQEQDARPSDL